MHSKHTQLLYIHLFNYCADTQGVTGHFLLLAKVIRFIRLGHVHMVLELVLVQLRMVKLIHCKLLHQVHQRCELQLEGHILDWLSESQNCQIDCLLLRNA